ncbi:nuclear pore complex protein Nup153-like isoform X2 [Oncorhynchus keta]|uniref:nuclear pore complex protein Nup153-like isoform X2 n=1 Tax=Oncorhynchus keta TaxID=8018 RepID=UPI0015F8FECC|nr:nuclear pore complex protein Nup153-like isoform X2 [Oncorhynchus keta]
MPKLHFPWFSFNLKLPSKRTESLNSMVNAMTGQLEQLSGAESIFNLAMAATGGGKIRSRRCHSASKPYAKSKQQQPGLISRVTDTVKSIVPSWLQKYFRNGEAAEGGGSVVRAEQNSQAPPPNGSEEVAPLPDGRDTPEPGTSHTEPSTSRASLNFQDVLSRPPLNRSHLHFPSLDTSLARRGPSSLFSQPSTSSAPFVGASPSFSLVKEIKDNSSQHEDDNISTTSGFSSRASDKDVPNSKTASLPQLWSPEMDRTHSGPQQSQSSLKKPAFNLSVFGTSSTSTMNSSVLNSSQLGDSPFYPGKTTYGGAASVRTARSRTAIPYQAPLRRQIKAKPAGAQPCGVTSATARRILQSLERMSSPLADAKRIPSTVSSPLSTSLDGSTLHLSHFQAKKKLLDSPLPPVQKLVIPAAASVSGNRSMSFRPSLTPGGLARTPRDTPTRQSPLIPEAVAGPSQSTSSILPTYPLSSTPAFSSTGSGGGKMKRERTSTRPSSKRPEDQIAELSDLPAISLPHSPSFSLPSFSFFQPPTATVTPTAALTTSPVLEETIRNKVPPTTAPSTPPSTPFTFSSPIVMATAASPPSFSPSSGFTFSAPVVKTGLSLSNGKMATPVLAAVKHAASESMDEFEGPYKPAKVLKQGSVLDLLNGPGFAVPVTQTSPVPKAHQETPALSTNTPSLGDLFKATTGSWDCDTCVVQNKPTDSKCVTSVTPRLNSGPSLAKTDSIPLLSRLEGSTTTTTPAATFGALFTKPAGSWDCDTCLVQNKPDAVKCVACETTKPGTGVKASLTMPAFLEAKTLPAAAPLLGFGDKFKKPEGAWECGVCMVQNKAQDTKCVSCGIAKPGATAAPHSLTPTPVSATPLLGFGAQFKKPEGAWECDVCCVENKGADKECVACQTPKPGAKVEPKAFGSSSFGIQSSSDSGGFKFGMGTSSDSGSGGFKFGGTLLDSSSSGGFKFGASASSDSTSTDTSSSAGFKFGGSSEGCKFAASAASTPAVDEGKKAEAPGMGAGFKFGVGGGLSFGTAAAASTESKPPYSGFSFHLVATSDSSSSTFSLPVSTENDSGASTETTTTTTTAAAPMFGKLAEAKATALTTPLGGSIFRESLDKDKAPSFTFGKHEKEVASMGSGFLFSVPSKEGVASAPSTGFSFSKPDPPKDQPNAPALAFEKPEDQSETPAAESPKPSFSFGQSTTDAAAPKPAFGFMASTTTTSSSSSSTPAPAPIPVPSTFLFGQSASTEATPAKSFLFGQSQDSLPAPAVSLNPGPAQPFLFGSGPNAAAPSFTFGAAAPSTAAPSAAPAPFVFSPASSTGFGSGQAPNFGQGTPHPSAPAFGSPAPSPFSATASQPPAFGAKPNSVPVFGHQANSTPAFGSSVPTTPGGGFQFGGASVFGTSSNSTGVFAFGGAPGGSPAPSATPSIAPQPSAPGSGFNFAAPPTFNIGSKSTTFTAAATGQHSIPGRKIKTAVRRKK